MPVPQSIDQRIRVMIWQWACQSKGIEDIEVLLKRDGFPVPSRDFIKGYVWRAAQVKR